MKIALITDQHFGARKNSKLFYGKDVFYSLSADARSSCIPFREQKCSVFLALVYFRLLITCPHDASPCNA